VLLSNCLGILGGGNDIQTERQFQDQDIGGWIVLKQILDWSGSG
jgi:hypothetical protein